MRHHMSSIILQLHLIRRTTRNFDIGTVRETFTAKRFDTLFIAIKPTKTQSNQLRIGASYCQLYVATNSMRCTRAYIWYYVVTIACSSAFAWENTVSSEPIFLFFIVSDYEELFLLSRLLPKLVNHCAKFCILDGASIIGMGHYVKKLRSHAIEIQVSIILM